MAPARVIVGFDPSTTGCNALWWAVREAARRRAALFVVHARPASWPVAWEPCPVLSGGPGQGVDHPACARQEVGDAVLLAVGELPTGLEVWVAPVTGELPARLLELAARPDDLLVVATSHSWMDRLRSRGRWRSPTYWRRRYRGELLIALGERDHELVPPGEPSHDRRRTPHFP